MRIRDARCEDREAWLRLWEGYIRFYEAAVPADVTERTWQRILQPDQPLIGRVAELDGRLAGLSICVLHEGTWSSHPVLYLEDLFVDPAARSRGIGRALMDDAIAEAKSRGCATIYWHTKSNNVAARSLYDRFGPADDFVRYRIRLEPFQ